MNGLLVAASLALAPQAGTITPTLPQAGGEVVLRYDASDPGAELSGENPVFATLRIVAPTGIDNRAVELRPDKEGVLTGTTVLPSDAAYVLTEFASRSAKDSSAGLRSMVYREDGEPAPGARAHGALSTRNGCLDALEAELKAHPSSYAAYRTKWFYITLFQRKEVDLAATAADLAVIGDAETPEALYARTYLHLLRGEEKLARAAVLRVLEVDPTSWAAERAVGDYEYLARGGIGTPEGTSQVQEALLSAMKMNPVSHLVRESLYGHWYQLDFETVRAMCDGWAETEPLNPLPQVIFAASCSQHETELEAGAAAALSGMNRLLKGDGHIASLDTRSVGEPVYLPWSCILAANIALKRNDVASAVSYARLYTSLAGDTRVSGHEVEAKAWEQSHNVQRAAEAWTNALVAGSLTAKDELRRLWKKDGGADGDFESHVTALVQLRRPSKERAMAPSFACTDMEGESLSLDELQGRVVVLNFWSLGCMPCKREIPSLNGLVEAFSGSPVDFLAFAPDGPKDIARYTEDHPFHYRQFPASTDVSRAFGISSLPVHVVIDRSGRIMATLGGAGDEQDERLTSLINLALAEQ